MKTFRIWFLVLLTLLLPLRAAVAAGMPCAAGGNLHAAATSPTSLHQPQGHAHGEMDHPGQAGQDRAAHHAGPAADEASADPGAEAVASVVSSADSCSLCAGCCGGTAIVSSLPTVAAPNAFGAVAFPLVAVAAPGFIPDGLERPPRSI